MVDIAKYWPITRLLSGSAVADQSVAYREVTDCLHLQHQNLWLIWRDLVSSSLCKCLSVIINTKTSGSGNGLADMSVRLIVPPKMCRLLILCALILLYSSVFKLCTDNTSGGPPPFFYFRRCNIRVFQKSFIGALERCFFSISFFF